MNCRATKALILCSVVFYLAVVSLTESATNRRENAVLSFPVRSPLPTRNDKEPHALICRRRCS